MAFGLRTGDGTLVGRGDEVGLLREAVAQVAAGRGRSVLVEGEPGIGKSALVAAGLAEASHHGCRVFRCSGDAAWQRLPLRVLADGLGVDIAELSPEAPLAGLGASADPVATMAERLLDHIDRLCTQAPVVLVLDDLHWVDEASALVWHWLSRSLDQLQLLLVAAARPVPRRAEVTALRRGLTAGDTTVVSLGPLPEPDVTTLVENLLDADVGPGLRRFVTGAAGNPLFVRESVAALHRRGNLRIRAGIADLTGDAPAAPVSLAAAIGGRLQILTRDTTDLIQLAAVLGAEFTVTDLATAAGRPATELTGPVEEALAASVLAEAGNRLAFRHPLIHQALTEHIPAGQQAALHRQAAQALAAAGAPVERVAQQLLAAPDPTDDWLLQWFDEAVAALTARAPQVAADLLDHALRNLPPDHPRREPLATHLVTALFLLGRYEHALRVAAPVLAVTADAAVAGRIVWTLGYALVRTLQHERALAVLGQALDERTLPPVWTARVRALHAMALRYVGRDAEAKQTALRAQAEGERAGDSLAIGYALHVQSMVQAWAERDTEGCLAAVDRALAVLGDQPETTDLRLTLLRNRMAALSSLGRPAEVDHVLGESLALAERAGTPVQLARLRLNAAELWYERGRWDDALAELDAAATTTPLQSDPRSWQYLHAVGALIAAHRDDRAALRRHLEAVESLRVTEGTGIVLQYAGVLQVARAVAAECDGQPAESIALLRAVLDPMSTPVRGELLDFSDMILPDMVRLVLAAGDHVTAQAATDLCEVDARDDPTLRKHAAALDCRGLLAADPATLLTAADTYHKIGLPLHRARTLENAAVLLARTGDVQAARTAYAEAVALYHRVDAAWDLRRAQTRLVPFGIGGTPHRTRPTSGWYALTPTELKVAHMVAKGLSNPDIAAALFLSRRTVQSHVSHILAKLQARSRREIAQAAARHTDQPATP